MSLPRPSAWPHTRQICERPPFAGEILNVFGGSSGDGFQVAGSGNPILCACIKSYGVASTAIQDSIERCEKLRRKRWFSVLRSRFVSAKGGTRTPIPLRVPDPKSGASASSATFVRIQPSMPGTSANPAIIQPANDKPTDYRPLSWTIRVASAAAGNRPHRLQRVPPLGHSRPADRATPACGLGGAERSGGLSSLHSARRRWVCDVRVRFTFGLRLPELPQAGVDLGRVSALAASGAARASPRSRARSSQLIHQPVPGGPPAS